MPDIYGRNTNMAHEEAHPQSGQNVTVYITGHPQLGTGLHILRLEDWWDRLTSGSWADAESNPAAILYAMRVAAADLPPDDEVVYGHIGHFGHLVHVSEIQE